MRRWRFHPLDLGGALLLVLALGAGAHAYELLHQPWPALKRVEPSEVVMDQPEWLTLTGTNFRFARYVMLGDLVLTTLEGQTETHLRVYCDPRTLHLPPDTYEIRVLNAWGRGEVLEDGVTVLPPPERLPQVEDAMGPLAPLKDALPRASARSPVALSAAASPTGEGMTWVKLIGVAQLSSRLSSWFRPGLQARGADGTVVAHILAVEEVNRCTPAMVHHLDALLMVVRPALQAKLIVARLLAAPLPDGTYAYQDAVLAADSTVTLNFPEHEVRIQLVREPFVPRPGAGRTKGVELDVRVEPSFTPVVERLNRGDLLFTTQGERGGQFLRRVTVLPDSYQVIQVELPVIERDGMVMLQHGFTDRPGPLQRGQQVRTATPAGTLVGTILNHIDVRPLQ